MYKHTTVKKSLILLVAVLMCLAVLLSACGTKPHKTVTIPDKIDQAEIESNGGIAVKYGKWIYYVNGYQSSVDSENTYVDTTDAPRVGSVVRIEADQIEEAVDKSLEEGKTTSVKAKDVAELVRQKAQIVIPRIYYTGNNTTPELNGIWIFDNRIYILTPNDQLTPGGNKQTNEAVLMSYDLGGGSEKRHYTFDSNGAQVWLYLNGTEVMATYVMNSELHVLTVASGKDELIADKDAENKKVSSVNFDVYGGYVYYLDANGSICKLAKGSTEPTVLVKNDSYNGEENTVTYTIKSVCDGSVYYTKADKDNSSIDNVVLYYTKDPVTEDTQSIALASSDLSNMKAYSGGKLVVVRSIDGFSGLYLIDKDTVNSPKCLLKPGYNQQSIRIDKIEGDVLFYTVNNVTYKKSLVGDVDDTKYGELYACGWDTAVSVGWAARDIVKIGDVTYLFTLGSNSVSVVRLDTVKKSNSSPATVITLTVADEK